MVWRYRRRWRQGRFGLFQSQLIGDGDKTVQLAVEPADAIEIVLSEFDAGQGACSGAAREFGKAKKMQRFFRHDDMTCVILGVESEDVKM